MASDYRAVTASGRAADQRLSALKSLSQQKAQKAASESVKKAPAKDQPGKKK